MFQHCFAVLICAALLSASGCSGGDNVKVYPVSGSITFEGAPMAGGGSIAFVPIGATAKQKGKAPGGQIDDEGNYVLETYSTGDGSIPGEFRVVITQETSEEAESTPDGTAPKQQTNNSVPQKLIIPAIYADFTNSPLKATVETKKNEINFNLKRQAQGEEPRPVQTGA